MDDFSGKIALITGGASGMGKATVQLLAARGATVVVADCNIEAARDLASSIRAKGTQALAVAVDVTQAAQVEDMVNKTVEQFGRLDILIHCAGISTHIAPLAEYPIEAWDRALAVNLSGSFYAMKYAIPALLKAGGGAIVTIASMMSSIAHMGGTGYVSSKHGVVGLTKAAALDYAKHGIRVNAVGPGLVDTPMSRAAITDDGMRDMLGAMAPIGRFATADEVAELICFLASDKASYISGAYYVVDGGYTIQ